jgi:transcriptional regulator with XRE-family HTH domain
MLKASSIQETFQMNQTAIGSYIARKRKEQNLTQEQLAEQLSVSNKTISKWENGVSHS